MILQEFKSLLQNCGGLAPMVNAVKRHIDYAS